MNVSVSQGPFSSPLTLERAEVERLMPHAPVWVMVDRVLDCRPPGFIRTEKVIQPDDPFIQAHFCEICSIYPGALLIEYASQSAYLLTRLSEEPLHKTASVMVLARCNASFISPARAGDTLTADVTQVGCLRGVIVCEAVVSCGERVVCRVKIFASPPGNDAPAASVNQILAGDL
jgi:3-hydroxyacyl-[acyl-carrier-protein] dehydratase